jgi:hypothetical protein
MPTLRTDINADPDPGFAINKTDFIDFFCILSINFFYISDKNLKIRQVVSKTQDRYLRANHSSGKIINK